MQNDVIGIHPKYGMVGRIEVQTYRIILQYAYTFPKTICGLSRCNTRSVHTSSGSPHIRANKPLYLSDRNLHRPVRTACNDLYSLFTAFQLVIRSAKFVRHAIHLVAAAFSQAACTNKRNISVTAVIVDLF